MLTSLVRGAAAGAAGTTALNGVTSLDMLLRARPASSTPEATVEKSAELAGVSIPGAGEDRDNRVSALGALTGIATGVGVGLVYGALTARRRPPVLVGALVTTVAALAGSNGPMTALGITDPRTWGTTDWVSDVVPHVAYGMVTALTLGTDR